MKKALFVLLLLIGAATMNASGHSVWLESRDQADVGDSDRLYALYGHLDDVTGITSPAIESAFLLAPDGQKTDLVSFGRALVSPALAAWAGQPAHVTQAQRILVAACAQAGASTARAA